MSAPSTHATPEGAEPRAVGHQDLSREGLLAQLPRDGDNRPLLGGIPLWAKLGQGGMGAVYYGVHPRLHNEVAVKVLPFHLADKNPILIKRFFAEARVAAKVKSPYIVNVMDVNEDEGVFYLVMEFVDGPTVAQILKRVQQGEPLPPIEGKVATVGAVTPAPVDPDQPPPPPAAGLPEWAALEICIGAAQGLQAAHAYDIIHRDVKPDNILVPRLPHRGNQPVLDLRHAKLADLGLAKPEDSNSIGTISQLTMGTPGYMAPEQIRDAKRAGKPADVFSLGATLYAMLAGRSPFCGNSVGDLLVKTITEPHTPLRSLRPDVSDVTHKVVDACLAKDPGDRFNDGAELLEALHLAAGGVQYPSAALRSMADNRQSGSRGALAGSGITPAPSAAASAVAAAVSAASNEVQTPPLSGRTPVPGAVGGNFAPAAAVALGAAASVPATAGVQPNSTALVVPLSARERAAARLDLTPPEPQPPVLLAPTPVPGAPPPQRISQQPPVIPDSLPDLQYSARVSRALSRLLRTQPGSRKPAPVWFIVGAVVLVAAGLAGWWFGFEAPRRVADRDYRQAIAEVREAEALAVGALDAQSEKLHWQAVLAGCQKALSARPDDAAARQAQVNAVAKLDAVTQEIKRSSENYSDAMAEAQTAEQQAHQAPDLRAMLARHQTALAAYQRALRAHADDPAARDGQSLARNAVDTLNAQIQAFDQALAAGQQAEAAATAAADQAEKLRQLTRAAEQFETARRIHAEPVVTEALARLARLLPASQAASKAADAQRQADAATDTRQRLALLQVAVASYRLALEAADTPATRQAWAAARRHFARDYFGGFLEVRRFDPYADRESRDNLLGFDLAPDQSLLAVRLPGAEIQLWSPAQPRKLRSLTVGAGLVLDARFLSNTVLATASGDKTARLWNVTSGEQLRLFQDGPQPLSHNGAVKFLAVSADSQYLLTAADDKTARIWEVANGRLVATLSGHTDWLSAAVFSADGRRVLTASHDKTARLWNAQTGELLREFKGHTGKLYGCAFDPAQPRILTVAEDHTARLWNLNTGEVLQTLQGHTGAVVGGDFAADGKTLVTASDDKTARLWDAETGECRFVLRGHTAEVNRARYGLDDSLLITTSRDNTVRVWDLADGALLTTLTGHTSPVFDARITADGRSIFTIGDHTVREWSNPLLPDAGPTAASADEAYRLALHDAAEAENAAKEVAEDPYVAQAIWERAARAWDRALRLKPDDPAATAARASARTRAAAIADQVAQREHDYAAAIAAAQTARTAALAAAQVDEQAGPAWRAWSRALTSARQALALKPADEPAQALVAECARRRTADYFSRLAVVARFTGHTGPVEAVAFAPDGKRLASAGQDAAVRLWDPQTHQSERLLEGHKAWPNQLNFSADGKLLLSADNVTVRLWDPLTGAALRAVEEPNEAGAGLAPDGRQLYTVTAGGALQRWDAATGAAVGSVDPGNLELARLSFSADRQWAVAQLANHALRLLNGATLKPLHQLEYTADLPVTQLTIAPDNRVLYAACLDGQVRRWALPGGQLLPALSGHRGKVYFVAVSPDSSLVLTGGEDRTARLYAADTGLEVNLLFGQADSCFAGGFAPDGRAVVVAAGNDLYLWCNPQDDQQPMLAAQAVRELEDTALARARAAERPLAELAVTHLDRAMRGCETALAWYRAALALHPNDAGARAGAAKNLLQWTAWRRQLEQYDAAMQAGRAALETAHAARLAGEDPAPSRAAAVKHFKAALEFNPGDSRAMQLIKETTLAIAGNPYEDFQAVRNLDPATAPVVGLRFAADGHGFLAAQTDGVVRWLDLTAGKAREFKDHTGAATAVDISPDGAIFASAALDKTVRLVNLQTGATLHILRVPSPVRTVAFSPTGKTVITGSEDGSARLWDTATATVYKELADHKAALTAARISRDADFVLTAGDDRSVKIWNLLEGKVVVRIDGHAGAVLGAVYSPDGKWVLSVSADNTVRLWAAADGKPVYKLEGHTDPVVAAAFLPNGKAFVTSSVDKTVRIWDAASGRELKRIDLGAVVRALTVSPDGKTILAGGDDKIVRLIADPNDKTNPLLFNR